MYTKLHYKWLSKSFDNQNFYLTAGLTAKHIALLTFMLSWCFLGFGQSNNCASAPTIAIGASCTITNYNVAQTFSNSGVSESCPGASFRDGWFSFTTDSSTTLINILGTSNRRLGLALYDNSCVSPNEISCTIPNNANASLVNVTVTPNTTYFLRLMRTNNNDANNMTGTICVYSPPSNDNCSGATPLTVNLAETCTTSASGITVGATQSIPAISCNGFSGNADDDVWYSFTATATNHDITVTPGTLNDAVMELRSGACNGTNIVCADETFGSDIEVINATGLTIGNTYLVRVYSWGGNGNQGTFDICVTTPIITYCEPETEFPEELYINSVSIVGTLSDPPVNNSTFDSSGYQNFTALTPLARQAQGEGVNIVTTCTGSGPFGVFRGVWKAWVDWNNNDSFEDAGELIYDSNNVRSASVSFGFVIPPATLPGNYRVRIRTGNTWFDGGTFSYNSCDNFEDPYNGETEDYLITVIENCNARITSVTDNDNCGPGTVTLSATSNLGGVTFNWYDSETGGTLLFYNTSGSFTTPVLTTTTTYYVTAQNGCETLVRVPVTATINPVSDVTFDPPTLESCGEENAITINASGDTEIVYLVDEDFESGDLGIFTRLNIENNENIITQWQNRTSPFVPSEQVWFPAISSGFGPNRFVMATSDVSNTNITHNAIISPLLNTSDFNSLILNFDMYFSRYATGIPENVNIDISTNGGTDWTTIQTYEDNIGYGTSFDNLNLDLIAYINQPNFRFRIRYFANYWCDGVAIDNIKLFGERPVVPSFTWTSLPTVDAFLDPTFTTPYVAGTPAATVYIRPSLAQLELSTFDISANITLSNGCDISKSITITNNSKVWIGGNAAAPVNWDNENNWRPTGVPNEDNCVIITSGNACLLPNNNIPFPVIDYEGEAKNLSIKNGGILDLQSFNNLTVTEAINMEATAILNIRSGANIVQINDVANTGAGAADMFRSTQIRRLDYVYWSTPVANFNVSQVSPNTSSSLIYEWLPTVSGNGAGNYGQWANASGVMAPGKGYIIRGPNNFTNVIQEYTANFKGRLNNGLITQNISRGTYTGADYAGAGTTLATAQDDNWNLIGNPYPSAINADAFTAANTNIDGTVYLWTHGTEISQANADPFYGDFGYNYTVSDYLAYNSTGPNPPGFDGFIGANQGFFVLMEHAAPTPGIVEFNNSMRVKNRNDQFFRNAEVIEKHRIWLDLLEPTGIVNTTLIGYVPGATNDKDRLYDAFSINNTAQTIYSRIQEQNMSIQGRALPFVDTDVIPLGVLIKQSGVHTIAINEVDGLFAQDQDIFIEDLELGIVHNLKQAPYFFTPESVGSLNNRFQLRYTNQTLTITDQQITNVSIYKIQNEVQVISPNQTIKSVSVHDMLGRIVGNYQNIDNNSFKFNLDQSNGTYIISAELDNGVVKTKKVIH